MEDAPSPPLPRAQGRIGALGGVVTPVRAGLGLVPLASGALVASRRASAAVAQLLDGTQNLCASACLRDCQ
eukprot:6654529-Pyramimonas_sp.AAC.1